MASVAGNYKCKSWEQIRRTKGYPKAWSFGHRGRFCYDGTAAWYSSYKGVSGYHDCHRAEGGLYDVSLVRCTEFGDKSRKVRFTDSSKVTAITRGFPISYTFTISVVGDKNGRIVRDYDLG